MCLNFDHTSHRGNKNMNFMEVLKVESQSGIKMWNLKVGHQSGVYSKAELAYKPEYYVNIWDAWMMDSFKATSSVLGKRSIPAELVNMIRILHTSKINTLINLINTDCPTLHYVVIG